MSGKILITVALVAIAAFSIVFYQTLNGEKPQLPRQAFYMAIELGDVGVLERFFGETPELVSQISPAGMSPLALAVSRHKLASLKWLTEHGAGKHLGPDELQNLERLAESTGFSEGVEYLKSLKK